VLPAFLRVHVIQAATIYDLQRLDILDITKTSLYYFNGGSLYWRMEASVWILGIDSGSGTECFLLEEVWPFMRAVKKGWSKVKYLATNLVRNLCYLRGGRYSTFEDWHEYIVQLRLFATPES